MVHWYNGTLSFFIPVSYFVQQILIFCANQAFRVVPLMILHDVVDNSLWVSMPIRPAHPLIQFPHPLVACKIKHPSQQPFNFLFSSLSATDVIYQRCIGYNCLDEEYVSCFIDCVKEHTVIPEEIRREKTRKSLIHTPKLARLIESQIFDFGGVIQYEPDLSRFEKVMRKLAFGHLAYMNDTLTFDSDFEVTMWFLQEMRNLLFILSLNYYFLLFL